MKHYQVKKTLLLALKKEEEVIGQIREEVSQNNSPRVNTLNALWCQFDFLHTIIQNNLKKMDYER